MTSFQKQPHAGRVERAKTSNNDGLHLFLLRVNIRKKESQSIEWNNR
jgi:hypothetical protein